MRQAFVSPPTGVSVVGFSLLSQGFALRAGVTGELAAARQQRLHVKLLVSNQRFGRGSFSPEYRGLPKFSVSFLSFLSPRPVPIEGLHCIGGRVWPPKTPREDSL